MAAAQVAAEAVVAWKVWVPTKNWMLRRVKGVVTVSVLPEQYSPGRSRKKKAIQARSAIAWSQGDPPLAVASMQWRMETGRGRTLPGEDLPSCRLKLSSQAKVDGAHDIESWFWVPHGRKDMSHGAELLFHASFVDGLVVCCEDAYADLLRKDL